MRIQSINGRTGTKTNSVVMGCLVALVLSGCSALQNQIFSEEFWASSPFQDNSAAELGIAEMAKGNYISAEANFKRALRSNPRDIDALLGAGILYQNTGQITKAREMYEAVLALRPDEAQQFVVWTSIVTKPASQVASVNLSLLESGKVGQELSNAPLNQAPNRMQPGTSGPGPGSSFPVTGAPSGLALLGRTAPPVSPSNMGSISGSSGSGSTIGLYPEQDNNVVSRFSTLRALRDQGLVTAQEFVRRRQTNLGSLLPLTSPPAAAGLDRSVPTTEQIGGRLRAIGRALEMRAISVSQHAAERNMILDALMPAAPVVVTNPAVPPRGLMEAADAVRRLEQLRDDGFISSDEYARERQAIELAMRPSGTSTISGVTEAPVASAKRSNNKKVLASGGISKPSELKIKNKAQVLNEKPAVHLASYRSQKQAKRGWAQIKRAHKVVLGSLRHEISRVRLGKKGVYFRLKAGPFESLSNAKTACGKLKRRRQFCETSTMGRG
ncbi:MAG: hypothetical protein CBB68_10235 [Rhodospirillaceae bacterium TMED8]|nr:hypothetical protein [Magnetovibrio sp.]OUT50230.1 MAG: hypothetical protein CBB68_10235 [Rhodospirillaceae bacterium TMED8]